MAWNQSVGDWLRGCGLVAIWLASLPVMAAPQIEFTQVPPFGSTQNLTGRVIDAAPSAYRVAVFIYVPGAGWWSKPYCDPQLTVIQPDSSWAADITTGGSDAQATRLTALLVPATYSEPCVSGPAALPASVQSQALASVSVYRHDPTRRWIKFSGYDWWLKTSASQVGPGPNYFSDSTNNVWVDDAGQLHLRITHRSNFWQCAELVSERTFGYGSYRFELGSPANNLNQNAVLGLFTWSDDPAFTHREIDVEISRWGAVADTNNAQFVVQPYDTAGHLARYRVPAGVSYSTHWFNWETNRVTFQSLTGGYAPSPAPGTVISNWNCSLGTPQTGDENVRLNLWLMNGTAPAGNQEVEFIIKSFQFVPPGPPKGASLLNPFQQPDGSGGFDLQGQPDRRYRVETSTNLADWNPVDYLLATNVITRYFSTNTGENRQYFRTVTLP